MKSAISQNVFQGPHNLTCILNTLKYLLKHIYEKVCNEKVNMKNDQKICTFTERLKQNTQNQKKHFHFQK